MAKTFLMIIPFDPLMLPSKETVIGGIKKYLPFIPEIPFLKSRSLKEQKQSTEAELQENLNQLRQRVDQAIEGLRAVGLDAVVLGDEELIELFYNFYNPETTEKIGVSIPQN